MHHQLGMQVLRACDEEGMFRSDQLDSFTSNENLAVCIFALAHLESLPPQLLVYAQNEIRKAAADSHTQVHKTTLLHMLAHFTTTTATQAYRACTGRTACPGFGIVSKIRFISMEQDSVH